MSATAVTAPLDDTRPGLLRLTQVELRKMVDTRAGRWLLGIVGVLILAVALIFALTNHEEDKDFQTFFQILQIPVGVILPVLGILLVTSEWSQRTALSTFTLVPDRNRIVLAKALAVVALTIAAIAATLVAAALGVPLAGDEGEWTFGAAVLGEVVVMQLVGFAGGLAFGLAFQASAPAIVLYFVLPTVIGILTEIIPGIRDFMRWIDLGSASTPFGEGDVTGTEWGRLGTAMLVWVGIPLAIGLWRLWRSEIK